MTFPLNMGLTDDCTDTTPLKRDWSQSVAGVTVGMHRVLVNICTPASCMPSCIL